MASNDEDTVEGLWRYNDPLRIWRAPGDSLKSLPRWIRRRMRVLRLAEGTSRRGRAELRAARRQRSDINHLWNSYNVVGNQVAETPEDDIQSTDAQRREAQRRVGEDWEKYCYDYGPSKKLKRLFALKMSTTGVCVDLDVIRNRVTEMRQARAVRQQDEPRSPPTAGPSGTAGTSTGTRQLSFEDRVAELRRRRAVRQQQELRSPPAAQPSAAAGTRTDTRQLTLELRGRGVDIDVPELDDPNAARNTGQQGQERGLSFTATAPMGRAHASLSIFRVPTRRIPIRSDASPADVMEID